VVAFFVVQTFFWLVGKWNRHRGSPRRTGKTSGSQMAESEGSENLERAMGG
jgi:hypothetical protein